MIIPGEIANLESIPAPREPAVRLIPMGGLGEIGLNMMLLESDADLIAVDCGLMFPDDEMPGIDRVIPDFSYLLAKKESLRGIILTHGHEDHIGALPYLLREISVPVYGCPLTIAFVQDRLREHELADQPTLRVIHPRERFELGDFRCEAIRVTHSIVDGIGFGIETPVGTIVHTGDFKLDASPIDGLHSDYQKFAELGERGVLALLSDSTNAERPGHTPSEMEVGIALAERFQYASGRIIVATFSSHIHRIQQVLDLSNRYGKKVALLGMSMVGNARIAAELGALRLPPDTLGTLEELAELPPYRQVILSTGSQGEPHSAIALMAAKEHRSARIEAGDLVIFSARVIPGNERVIGRVINQLFRLGAEVLWEEIASVHVSGHASREDLKLMLNLTRPRFFIPVHGEYRHLIAHGRLAAEVGIPRDRIFVIEDGIGIELTKDEGRVLGRFPVGRKLVDGKGVGDVGTVVLRDRQLLAEAGMVVVAVTIDKQSGELLAGPEIVSRGFVYVKESEALMEEAKEVVRQALAERDASAPVDKELLGSLIRSAIRRFINQRYDRKPIVLPVILEV